MLMMSVGGMICQRHQENRRALFYPGTVCDSLAELEDCTRAIPTDHQSYRSSVSCIKMVICVEGEKYLSMP